jgi:hypothetical protein
MFPTDGLPKTTGKGQVGDKVRAQTNHRSKPGLVAVLRALLQPSLSDGKGVLSGSRLELHDFDELFSVFRVALGGGMGGEPPFASAA